MARPRKEGLDYFPHDTDAVADEKIDAMRALYGNDGYAFYFILLERCYSTAAGEFDLSKPAIFVSVVKKIMVSEERFLEMLDTAFDIELFDRQAWEERKVITSNGVRKRVEKVDEERYKNRLKKSKKKASASENPEKTPLKSKEENSFTEVLPSENPEKTPESKVKKSKVNKNIYINAREGEQEIFALYENEVKAINSQTEQEQLAYIAAEYPPEWVKQAILIVGAKKERMKRNVKYLDGILQGWADQFSLNDKPWLDRDIPPDKCRGKPNRLKGAEKYAEYD